MINPWRGEIKKDLRFFIIVLLSLLLLGMSMIYSASYIYAMEEFGSASYFLYKQFIFVVLSIVSVFILSKTKFSFWYKNSYFFHLCFAALVILCFFPGISLEIKGASRWLKILGFTLQPGEFLKYSTLLCSLHFFQNFDSLSSKQRFQKLSIIVVPMFLLLVQPDFGMFFLCSMNMVLACFISDFPRKWFYSGLFIGSILLVSLIGMAPYRVRRLMSYLNPWDDPMASGFQVIQSFLAFALGGFWGSGMGNSKEKLFYLPEAHNDFIFSVIGEELGLWGTFGIMLLFLLFAFKGISLALRAKTKTKSFFAVLVVTSITFQAIINMGVVIGLLPTKGLNLPFISYGGSSLLANALLLGLFFSVICKNEPTEVSDYQRYT